MMARKYPIPESCPVCKSKYMVSQLRCEGCGTRLEGSFSAGRLSNLNDKQTNFVETFLMYRGNIQKVGRALGISYPTVRNRLDEILDVLGLSSEEDDILTRLQNGEISVEEAAALISKNKEDAKHG